MKGERRSHLDEKELVLRDVIQRIMEFVLIISWWYIYACIGLDYTLRSSGNIPLTYNSVLRPCEKVFSMCIRGHTRQMEGIVTSLRSAAVPFRHVLFLPA